MKKEFVPYDRSLRLKALGFDEPCFGYWNIDPQLKTPAFNMVKPFEHDWCLPASTFSQAFRWFREKHNWQNSIDPTADQHSRKLGYNYWIWNYKTGEEYHTMPKNRPTGDWDYETYEETELACLDKLLEIVETKSTQNTNDGRTMEKLIESNRKFDEKNNDNVKYDSSDRNEDMPNITNFFI